MCDTEKLKKKLHTALKFNGFIIRSEYINLIFKSLAEGDSKINNDTFNFYLKVLCDHFERHIDREKCISKEMVEKAIETCIHIGVDDRELKFGVIDAFDYPKCVYDITKKHYFIDKVNKSQIVGKDITKSEMFINRYRNALQRTQRNFNSKNLDLEGRNNFVVNTVDSLLTSSHKALERTFILGALYVGVTGKYFLEDPTGMVELNLKHTNYHFGFYLENMYVLVNGIWADKVLTVSSMMLPPAEEFQESKVMFTHLNYFGGTSSTLLRDSNQLDSVLKAEHKTMVFISDLWLDHEIVYEKLEKLLEGFEDTPPIAIVFIGNFLSQEYDLETFGILGKSFQRLAEMIKNFCGIYKYTNIIFVPGLNDPCTPHILPRFPLPKYLSKDFKKIVPNAIFTTNPCRIQYCNREIVIYKNDLMSKFMQDSIHKPTDSLPVHLARTITAQGHLSPFSLNAQPVHWDFDYTLHLYPLPNLVVVGDKCFPYLGKHKRCTVINPGSFIESGFAFKTYIPAIDTVDECTL